MLCGIYVGLALTAVCLIFFLLDNYDKIGLNDNQQRKENKSPINLLVNTLKHIKNKNQLLIIPLTLYSGFEQAYIGADFTKVKLILDFSILVCGTILLMIFWQPNEQTSYILYFVAVLWGLGDAVYYIFINFLLRLIFNIFFLVLFYI
jgi:hypothetical protein